MELDNREFEKAILSLCPSTYSDDRFPLVYEDTAGDCLEIFQSDEPHYGERIDDRVTVYVGQDSGEIIGVMVKGLKTWIRRILNEYPGFRLDIEQEEPILGVLFHLQQLEVEDPSLQMRYLSLRKVAKSWRVMLADDTVGKAIEDIRVAEH